MMNQNIYPILVQLDIDRIKKILKNRKGDNNAALDIIQNEIDNICSNSSGINTLINKAKTKLSNFIEDKHGKKKSKTVCSKNVSTFNKKRKAVSDFELEKCTKNNNGKKKHHCERKSKCKYKNLKMNLHGLKDVPNNHLEIKQICSKDDATNINNNICIINLYKDEGSLSAPDDSKNVPFIVTTNKTSSEIVIISNNSSMDEYYKSKKSIQTNFSEKKLNDTLSSSTFDIIVVSDDDDDNDVVIINDGLSGSNSEIIYISSDDDDVDVIISNTTNVDESNKSKKSIQTNFSEKKLNDALSSSISDITDFILDSELDTTDTKLDDNFDYTKDEKYEKLSYIVLSNINIYDKQIMIEFGKKLRKDNLLEELRYNWNLSKAEQVKSILEDILKLIFDMENKSIIFMGCLSNIFRKTINDLYEKSYEQLYGYFQVYTDVIKMCLYYINEHLWKTMIPNGWNVFCNGCLIVDVILFGSSLSLGEYVNWKEIPQCDVSITPSISDITTEKAVSSITNTRQTANNGEPVLKKRSFLSMSSTSRKKPLTLPLASDEILAKKKKLDNA